LNSGLVSFDKRVSAPPWGWSLVTGEPRDCLCILQRQRPNREKGCFAIDLFSRVFLIRSGFLTGELFCELLFTCRLIFYANNFPFLLKILEIIFFYLL